MASQPGRCGAPYCTKEHLSLIVWDKIGVIGSRSVPACYFSCHKIGSATHTEVSEAKRYAKFPTNNQEVVSLKVTSKISVDQCVNPWL